MIIIQGLNGYPAVQPPSTERRHPAGRSAAFQAAAWDRTTAAATVSTRDAAFYRLAIIRTAA
jgi:hypothetical protein